MTSFALTLASIGAVIAAVPSVVVIGMSTRAVYREARWRIARRRINRIHAEMRGAAARRAMR